MAEKDLNELFVEYLLRREADLYIASDVDLERGIFFRKAIGRRAKRRQTPAPSSLAVAGSHASLGQKEGDRDLASVRKRFGSGVALAMFAGNVTPHTLRHTAATWLTQRGVPLWEAAGFL